MAHVSNGQGDGFNDDAANNNSDLDNEEIVNCLEDEKNDVDPDFVANRVAGSCKKVGSGPKRVSPVDGGRGRKKINRSEYSKTINVDEDPRFGGKNES